VINNDFSTPEPKSLNITSFYKLNMNNIDISVREVDEKAWLEFTAHCKLKKLKVGTKLSEILSKFLKTK